MNLISFPQPSSILGQDPEPSDGSPLYGTEREGSANLHSIPFPSLLFPTLTSTSIFVPEQTRHLAFHPQLKSHIIESLDTHLPYPLFAQRERSIHSSLLPKKDYHELSCIPVDFDLQTHTRDFVCESSFSVLPRPPFTHGTANRKGRLHRRTIRKKSPTQHQTFAPSRGASTSHRLSTEVGLGQRRVQREKVVENLKAVFPRWRSQWEEAPVCISTKTKTQSQIVNDFTCREPVY